MAHPLARLFAGFSRKAAVPAPASMMSGIMQGSFASMFLNPSTITPSQAHLLYLNVAPFAKIVDLIADNVASLMPLVKIDGKPVDGHPALGLLNRPGFNRTRRRFIKEATVQYLVTGTAYVQSYGNVGAFPVALDVLKTKNVTHFPGHDNWPLSFMYSEGQRTVNFERDPNPRDPRYLDITTGFTELIPIYDMEGDYRGIGLPRLNAIRSDVELRLKGIQHNSSLMDKGARLSGVVSYKESLTVEQQQAISEQWRAMAQGANNAGAVLVTAGGEFDFAQLSQSAKDMDFIKLMNIVEDAMASRYNVPVSLFRTDAQTNNNYETAWNVLYDQAILPTFDVIYSGLAAMFSERLGMAIEIVHDALTAPILARQASGRARELFAAQLLTRNEAREIIGYEPVLGGDTILAPMGLVPIGEDMFTQVDEALGKDRLDARRERLAGVGAKPKAPATPKPAEDTPSRSPGKPDRGDQGEARAKAMADADRALKSLFDRIASYHHQVH